MTFFFDVFEGPQASIGLTHMEGGIVWRILDVSGSKIKLIDGKSRIYTYNYLVFFRVF